MKKYKKSVRTLSGAQIKGIRQKLNVTLEQVGRLTQTSFVTWCRWEHGSAVDPLHNAILTLLDRAVRKAGSRKVVRELGAAAATNDRVAMLRALVHLSS